jgi:hypothetical protein
MMKILSENKNRFEVFNGMNHLKMSKVEGILRESLTVEVKQLVIVMKKKTQEI